MEIRADDTGMRGTVIFREGLTVSHVSEARTAILEALERFEEVYLDVDGVSRSTFASSTALRRAADGVESIPANRVIGQASDAFRLAAARAGGCFHRECGPGDEVCPWQEGNR